MSVFGETLDRTRIERGHSQRTVADWITDWLDTNDLEHELSEQSRTVAKHNRARLEEALAVIYHYLRSYPEQAAAYHTSQAAVSKWKNGTGGQGRPTPEKWLPIAKYMEIPLWEVYEMVSREGAPTTAPALRRQLDATNEELAEAKATIDRQDALLAQLQENLRLVELDLAEAHRRLIFLEAVAGVEDESEETSVSV